MSTSREHNHEQDILTSRWEAIPARLEERLAELLVEEESLVSYKCSADIAFTVILTDGTSVSFDWAVDDGCLFEVTPKGGVPAEILHHDGDPAGFGHCIDWVESLAEEPFEVVLQVVETARRGEDWSDASDW